MFNINNFDDRPERDSERELDFIDIPDWPSPDPERWAEYLRGICSEEEIQSVQRNIDELSQGEEQSR